MFVNILQILRIKVRTMISRLAKHKSYINKTLNHNHENVEQKGKGGFGTVNPIGGEDVKLEDAQTADSKDVVEVHRSRKKRRKKSKRMSSEPWAVLPYFKNKNKNIYTYEYFMGGKDRVDYILRLFQGLEESKCVLRVLTRGYALMAHEMLQHVDMGRYVDSTWDTSGNGVYQNGDIEEIDREILTGNKLDIIHSWALEMESEYVLFVEDSHGGDQQRYEAWNYHQSKKPEGIPYVQQIILLDYECEGITKECSENISSLVDKYKDKNVLVVLDFDCTVTAKHCFKTLIWSNTQYAEDFQNWKAEHNNSSNSGTMDDSLDEKDNDSEENEFDLVPNEIDKISKAMQENDKGH